MSLEGYFRKLLDGDELGASFVVYREGQELMSLHGGWRNREESVAWTADTLAPVWSATKAPMAVCVLMALHRVGMNEETLVRRVWPELQVGEATFGEMFSHQCGLAALDEQISIWDREAVVQALEKQTPKWGPGTHGYHPRTIGFLADEIVRRIDGRALGGFWRQDIAEPEGIDFWIGLPESEHHRVAILVPARYGQAGEPKAFYDALLTKGSLTRQAFRSPTELSGVTEMNTARAWQAGFPAMGGVCSADGLAKFYDWVLRQNFLPELIHERVSGFDEIQRVPSAFGFGMKLEGDGTFGHPGAGGSYGLADPKTRTACALVVNRFESNLFASDKRRRLAELAFELA